MKVMIKSNRRIEPIKYNSNNNKNDDVDDDDGNGNDNDIFDVTKQETKNDNLFTHTNDTMINGSNSLKWRRWRRISYANMNTYTLSPSGDADADDDDDDDDDAGDCQFCDTRLRNKSNNVSVNQTIVRQRQQQQQRQENRQAKNCEKIYTASSQVQKKEAEKEEEEEEEDEKKETCDSQRGQASQMAHSIMVTAFMAVFVSVVQLYTWITLPIYFLAQKPWVRQSASNRNRLKQMKETKKDVEEENEEGEGEEERNKSMSPIFVRDEPIKQLHPIVHLETVTEILDIMVEFHGANNEAIGYRQVLSEEDSLDDHGKVRRIDGRALKRYRLSGYKWLTYRQMDSTSRGIAQALFAKGITASDKVLIISETRVEWMLCAQAIVRTGATIVTLFSNLGLDGVTHGITETQCSTVIASIDCLPLLEKMLRGDTESPNRHAVRRLIYIDGFAKPDLAGFASSIETYALSELEQEGKRLIANGTDRSLFRATPDHLMMIMFTSGTTGTPKAALFTHRQFMASLQALYVLVQNVIDEAPFHTYISYLPMAHVLELTVESFFLFGGVRIGYASPFTLTDSAPGLAAGQKCDIKLLRPTIITAVPLVLDRILKEISEKLRSRTPISEPIFTYLMRYKSCWTRRGYRCNIVKQLLCKKVREQFGGKLEYMIVGGAPLDARMQATIKSALDITLVHGYGATETTGAAMAMDLVDLDYGAVGAPLHGVMLRLRDWPEGGYSHTDRPHPRGEILLGGDTIAAGYFRSPAESAEAFFVDSAGRRWFRTGDIGLLRPNGTIEIIDRRKDLVKLQNGEYISLGKVESALKSSQYVDNICVHGGTFGNHLVALISANRKAINQLLKRTKRTDTLPTWHEICADREIEQEIYDDVIETAKLTGLGKKEIPLRIKLVPDEWSPDNGILTAALKLKRKTIESNYREELSQLCHLVEMNPKIGNTNRNRKRNGEIFHPKSLSRECDTNNNESQVLRPLVSAKHEKNQNFLPTQNSIANGK